MVVIEVVCDGRAIGRSSEGETGKPFNRLEELCGCDIVGTETVE